MKPKPVVLTLALASAGCSTFALKHDQCPAYPAPVSSAADPEADVKVQYLGSGGYLVKRGEDVVLFGPVYSNPTAAELAANHTIRTDRALVDLLLPDDAKTKTDAIVIGHGHADHAMDTPYIANQYATSANVYGSATLKNLIQSEVKPSRIVDVAQAAKDKKSVPIEGTRMRLWPIRSQHSDQTRMKSWLLGLDVAVHMWRGEVTEPMSRLPATASEWAEGEPYAYVLDFMDASNTKVEFRVYYQDTGTDRPIGYPWGGAAPPDGKAIDVVLICLVGDFERLADHPGGIIDATRPRFVVLGHWENFFEPQTDICRTEKVDAIPHFKVNEFVGEAEEAMKENAKTDARLKGKKPILACPTASVFHFPVKNTDDKAVHDAIQKRRATYDCSKVIPPVRR